MKKLNFWLLASLFTAALTLTACGGDDDGPSSNPGGNGNGEEQPGEPALTINDLAGTTWEVWASKENAPEDYQRLTIGADNSFTLHQNWESDVDYDYIGTWEEKDGNILLSYTKYNSDTGTALQSATQAPLQQQ